MSSAGELPTAAAGGEELDMAASASSWAASWELASLTAAMVREQCCWYEGLGGGGLGGSSARAAVRQWRGREELGRRRPAGQRRIGGGGEGQRATTRPTVAYYPSAGGQARYRQDKRLGEGGLARLVHRSVVEEDKGNEVKGGWWARVEVAGPDERAPFGLGLWRQNQDGQCCNTVRYLPHLARCWGAGIAMQQGQGPPALRH